MSITIWAPVNRAVSILRDRGPRLTQERAVSVILGGLVRVVRSRRWIPETVPEFMVAEALEIEGLVLRDRGMFVPTGRAMQIVSSMRPELLSEARRVGEARSLGLVRGKTKRGAAKRGAAKPAKRGSAKRGAATTTTTKRVRIEECGCVCKCGKGLKIEKAARRAS